MDDKDIPEDTRIKEIYLTGFVIGAIQYVLSQSRAIDSIKIQDAPIDENRERMPVLRLSMNGEMFEAQIRKVE